MRLAQVAPADTNVTLLLQAKKEIGQRVKYLVFANTTGSAAKYNAYIVFGEASGASNALFFEVNLSANTTDIKELFIDFPPGEDQGAIFVKSDTADAIAFTALGEKYAN